MSGLTVVLLGLAAYLGERGSRAGRRRRIARRLGPSATATPSPARATVPHEVIWGGLGAAMGYALGGAIVAVAGAVAGVAGVRVREGRSMRAAGVAAQAQLADAVSSMAAAIRAGRSVPQAISFTAAEAEPPLRGAMRRLDESLVLGVPFDDAVAEWTRALDSGDARLVAGVLKLHRRSGGDLPSVLEGVAGTLRERRAAGDEIRALTAQARLSGTILGVLPFGFFAFLWLTSRDEIEGALRSPAGLVAIGLGLVLEGAAFLWIRHLLEVR